LSPLKKTDFALIWKGLKAKEAGSAGAEKSSPYFGISHADNLFN
jgi:hypothetical protein